MTSLIATLLLTASVGTFGTNQVIVTERSYNASSGVVHATVEFREAGKPPQKLSYILSGCADPGYRYARRDDMTTRWVWDGDRAVDKISTAICKSLGLRPYL
jgi:hypothetical protein